jgi:Rieske 2Fe-2S family protein
MTASSPGVAEPSHPIALDQRGRTDAPIDPVALDRSLRPFGYSTMLPATAYTDPELHRWERRQVLAGSWTCLGRADELPSDGATQQALTVGDIPVLLTRTAAGALRAFANTCPHRGHELLSEGCTAGSRSLVCPYHAWSFGLDGRLIGAPRMRDISGFNPMAMGLTPLPLEVWQGWVMVNATGTAAPLADHLGALDALVAPYRPADLRLGGRHQYTLAVNWKVIVENYHECYHCPLIHPELCAVTPPDSGDNYDLPGAWVGGSMDLRADADTMSLDGRSLGVPIDGVDQRTVQYLGLFPNLLLSLHPDYVMAHRLMPLTADRTWVECSWYFPAAAFETEGFDPAYAIERTGRPVNRFSVGCPHRTSGPAHWPRERTPSINGFR